MRPDDAGLVCPSVEQIERREAGCSSKFSPRHDVFMRTAVIGRTSFIGPRLVNRLRERVHDVVDDDVGEAEAVVCVHALTQENAEEAVRLSRGRTGKLVVFFEMSRDAKHGGDGWGFGVCLWAPSAKENGTNCAFWSSLLCTARLQRQAARPSIPSLLVFAASQGSQSG